LNAKGIPMKPFFQRGGRENTTFCQKAHQVRVHPNNRFVYIPCLGSDYVQVLAFDASKGTLQLRQKAKNKSGAGPRHMDFHPSKSVAYVVNELDSTVNVFSIQANQGTLTLLQTITTLPKGTTSPSKSSDIHVSPDGRFVYAINREPLNNIAIFSVDTQGKLTSVGHISSGGIHSRSFVIDKHLPYMFVANAKSNNVVTFRVDKKTGKLTKLRTLSKLQALPYFVGILWFE